MAAKAVRKVNPDLEKRTLEELWGILGRSPKPIDRDSLVRKVMRHRGKRAERGKAFNKKWAAMLSRK